MEIKPVEEEQKLDYPKDEETLKNGKKKRTIKTWQKIAITGVVLTGLTVGGIAIYKTVIEPEEFKEVNLGGVISNMVEIKEL